MSKSASQQILKEFCCLPAFLEQYFGAPKTSFKKKYFENPQSPKAISEPSPKKEMGLSHFGLFWRKTSRNLLPIAAKFLGLLKPPPPSHRLLVLTTRQALQTEVDANCIICMHQPKYLHFFLCTLGLPPQCHPFTWDVLPPVFAQSFFPPRVPDNLFKFEFEFQMHTSFPFGHCSVSTRPHINFSRHPLPYQP